MCWTITQLLHIFSRKLILQVQTAVGSLRESAVNRTSQLQNEISTAQDFTSSVREKWGFYMEETENNYIEDTTAVDSGRSCLAEVLVEW
jgi:kinesin family protein 11